VRRDQSTQRAKRITENSGLNEQDQVREAAQDEQDREQPPDPLSLVAPAVQGGAPHGHGLSGH